MVHSSGPTAEETHAAFVYGSVAKGSDRAGSDIDIVVISDTLTYPDMFDALQSAEAALARPVNPNVMTRREWRAKRGEKDSFASRIAGGARVFPIGSEDDVA